MLSLSVILKSRAADFRLISYKSIRNTLTLALSLMVGQSGSVFCIQFSGHKSEAEIEMMTPEQRVEEYCREYARHGAQHGQYTGTVHNHVMKDGVRALPAITRIVDEYDPTTSSGRRREKGRRLDAASGLLLGMDETVMRVRASQEGRVAIDAIKRAIERMRVAGFNNNDKYKDDFEYDKRVWYESSVDAVQRMEGTNWGDDAIANTLRIRRNIRLTPQELLDFVNYLISKDAHYPALIHTDLYKDLDDLNEAGNPRQYRIVTDIDRFYKAYREYKAKAK